MICGKFTTQTVNTPKKSWLPETTVSNARWKTLLDIARQGKGGRMHFRRIVARFKCCICESRMQYFNALKS